MTCYTPLSGFYSKEFTKNGKRKVVFNKEDGYHDQPVKIPCGQCDGCKKSYTRQWAVRCMHEAASWEKNVFLTLTYDEKNLPLNGTLVPDHFTNFMKYLRSEYGTGIRFYGCGEYGSKGERPHYHVLLFNHDFDDKKIFGGNESNILYTSGNLSKIWKKGIHTIGKVTWESACYVARYVMKKVPDRVDPDHYLLRHPEFVRMSRRPGIGKYFYDKYKEEIWANDSVIMNKRELAVPKYYQDKLELENAKKVEELKNRRARRTKKVDEKRLFNMSKNQEQRKKKAAGKRSYEDAN